MSETIKANGVEITVDVSKTEDKSAKDLWDALEEVSAIASDDLIDEFDVEYLCDIFDVHNADSFMAAYKRFKEHEAEIRVGDEVEWTCKTYTMEYQVRGVVIDTVPNGLIKVLTNSPIYGAVASYYVRTVGKGESTLRKTGVRVYDLASLLEKK